MPKITKKAAALNTRRTAADYMPQSEESVRILRERSQLISRQKTEETERHDGTAYVRFRIGPNEFYGIPYHYINEVIGTPILTKVPNVADFISGIINRRGSLLAVLDLKKFFRLAPVAEEKNTYIFVVKSAGVTVGILADSIEGSDMYDSSTLESPLTFEGAIKPEYVVGLHHGVTTVLNIDTIVSDPRFSTRV